MSDCLGRVNLVMAQGATFSLPITWTSDETPPVPRDLTGKSARMQIRKTDYKGRVLLDLDSDDGGITFPDREEGEILVTITAEQSLAMLPGVHVYDLIVYDADTEPTDRLIQGTFTVDPAVTRDP